MKAADACIAWTPAASADAYPDTAGQVKVDFISRNGWTDKYALWNYAVEREDIADESEDWRVLINFHTMVVRDGIDPQVAHQAFLALDEYRRMISPDIPGAAI